MSFPETGLADDPNVTKEMWPKCDQGKVLENLSKNGKFSQASFKKPYFLPIHKIVKVSKSELASRSAWGLKLGDA